eukprot:PhM_4_TR18024/c1_g3_i1/m.93155
MAIANDPTVPTRPRPRVASQAASSPDITAFARCDVLGWECRPTPDSDHAIMRYTVAVGNTSTSSAQTGVDLWTSRLATVPQHGRALLIPPPAPRHRHRVRQTG